MSDHCTWCGLELPSGGLIHCSPADCLGASRTKIERLKAEAERLRIDLECEKAISRDLAANIGAVAEYVSSEGSDLAKAVGGRLGDDVGPIAVRMLRRMCARNEELEEELRVAKLERARYGDAMTSALGTAEANIVQLEEALRPFAVMADEDLPNSPAYAAKFLRARQVLGYCG